MKLTDIQKWPKDEPDDPASALGWMAAREAAAGICDRRHYSFAAASGRDPAKYQSANSMSRDEIRALPAPTSAQLLAEAMRLAQIAALVEAAQACVHTSPPHKSHVDLESALAAIKEATQ